MKKVTVHQAKTHLSKLLKEVERGAEVVITRRDKPVARLVAVGRKKPRRELGRGKGLVRLADDFDAPLPDFADHER